MNNFLYFRKALDGRKSYQCHKPPLKLYGYKGNQKINTYAI
jgi:hypothetical protein